MADEKMLEGYNDIFRNAMNIFTERFSEANIDIKDQLKVISGSTEAPFSPTHLEDMGRVLGAGRLTNEIFDKGILTKEEVLAIRENIDSGYGIYGGHDYICDATKDPKEYKLSNEEIDDLNLWLHSDITHSYEPINPKTIRLDDNGNYCHRIEKYDGTELSMKVEGLEVSAGDTYRLTIDFKDGSSGTIGFLYDSIGRYTSVLGNMTDPTNPKDAPLMLGNDGARHEIASFDITSLWEAKEGESKEQFEERVVSFKEAFIKESDITLKNYEEKSIADEQGRIEKIEGMKESILKGLEEGKILSNIVKLYDGIQKNSFRSEELKAKETITGKGGIVELYENKDKNPNFDMERNAKVKEFASYLEASSKGIQANMPVVDIARAVASYDGMSQRMGHIDEEIQSVKDSIAKAHARIDEREKVLEDAPAPEWSAFETAEEAVMRKNVYVELGAEHSTTHDRAGGVIHDVSLNRMYTMPIAMPMIKEWLPMASSIIREEYLPKVKEAIEEFNKDKEADEKISLQEKTGKLQGNEASIREFTKEVISPGGNIEVYINDKAEGLAGDDMLKVTQKVYDILRADGTTKDMTGEELVTASLGEYTPATVKEHPQEDPNPPLFSTPMFTPTEKVEDTEYVENNQKPFGQVSVASPRSNAHPMANPAISRILMGAMGVTMVSMGFLPIGIACIATTVGSGLIGLHQKDQISKENADMELVKKDGNLIRYVDKPSERVMGIAVTENPAAIRHIKNPTEGIRIYACNADGNLIRYLSPEQMTIKIQASAVTSAPDSIKYIPMPSETIKESAMKAEERQMDVVSNNPADISKIPHPTEKVQIIAVEARPDFIKDIKSPTESVQLKVVAQDASLFKDIAKPTENVTRLAVSKEPQNFLKVSHPTEQVKQIAVQKDPDLIRYIKNPSKEVKNIAIDNNPMTIRHIENPTQEDKLRAVSQNPKSLLHVPDRNSNQEVQMQAVTKDGGSVRFISTPSFEVAKRATETSPESVNQIRDDDIQRKVVADNPKLLEKIIDPDVRYKMVKDNPSLMNAQEDPIDNIKYLHKDPDLFKVLSKEMQTDTVAKTAVQIKPENINFIKDDKLAGEVFSGNPSYIAPFLGFDTALRLEIGISASEEKVEISSHEMEEIIRDSGDIQLTEEEKEAFLREYAGEVIIFGGEEGSFEQIVEDFGYEVQDEGLEISSSDTNADSAISFAENTEKSEGGEELYKDFLSKGEGEEKDSSLESGAENRPMFAPFNKDKEIDRDIVGALSVEEKEIVKEDKKTENADSLPSLVGDEKEESVDAKEESEEGVTSIALEEKEQAETLLEKKENIENSTDAFNDSKEEESLTDIPTSEQLEKAMTDYGDEHSLEEMLGKISDSVFEKDDTEAKDTIERIKDGLADAVSSFIEQGDMKDSSTLASALNDTCDALSEIFSSLGIKNEDSSSVSKEDIREGIMQSVADGIGEDIAALDRWDSISDLARNEEPLPTLDTCQEAGDIVANSPTEEEVSQLLVEEKDHIINSNDDAGMITQEDIDSLMEKMQGISVDESDYSDFVVDDEENMATAWMESLNMEYDM